MEVKFATRFDSPACLDLFDRSITLSPSKDKSSSTLHVQVMCRNDNKLLKYHLDLDLFDEVEDFADPNKEPPSNSEETDKVSTYK